MKINNAILLGTLLIVGTSLAYKVSADAAPATPPYSNIGLKVQVGLGSMADRFVIINNSNRYGTYYSLVTQPYVSPGSYGANTYFALDKNYFEKNGGIDGLFNTSGQEEDTTMSPKNEQEFNSYKYDFIISKDDPLLNNQFGDNQNQVAGDKYVLFPFTSDFYIRQGPDDPNCETGYNNGTKDCSMGTNTSTYLPQQIYGNKILLVKNSENLNSALQPPIAPPVPPATTATVSNQNSQPQIPVVTPIPLVPPVYVPWYQKFWNFLKALF